MRTATILMLIGFMFFAVGIVTFGWFTFVPIGVILFLIGLVMMLGSGTKKACRAATGDRKGSGRL